jgi:hypothetical protein
MTAKDTEAMSRTSSGISIFMLNLWHAIYINFECQENNMKAALLIIFVFLLSSIALSQVSVAQVSVVDYNKVEQSSMNALQKFFSAKAEISVGGTEYARGIDTAGKVFANIILGNVSLDNANCLTNIYNPDNIGKFLTNAPMSFIEKGIYVRDFPIAANMTTGVYPLTVECYFPINNIFFNASSYQVYNGTYTSGSVANTTIYDGVSLRFTEALYASGVRTVNATLNMSADITSLTENVIIEFGGEWNGGAGSAGEDVKLSVFNFSSGYWIDFSNRVIDAVPQSPVNVTNSLPQPFSDFFLAGNLRLKFEDIPVGTDNANSVLDIDRLQVHVINNATLAMNGVRGTGEIHVTKNMVLEILKSEIGEELLSNHNVCADNMTLTHILSKIRCIDTNCINISQNVTEPCQYGCNDREVPNSCNPSPFQVNLWLIVIFLAAIIIIAALVAKRG